MGFWGKMLGLGVIAGATAAVIKIAEKYNENKKKDAASDEYVSSDVITDVVRATGDFYDETVEKVRNAAASVKSKASDISSKAPDFFERVGDEVKDACGDVGGSVKSACEEVGDSVKDAAEKIKSGVKNAAENAKGDVVETTAEEIPEK